MAQDGDDGLLTLDAMSVLMILQGGPLDGERQVVEMVPTDPGSQLLFHIPNWQTFATDGTTVVDLGLQVVYGYLQPGGPPGTNDVWDTSWIYEFVSEAFVAPPAPITPPVQPPDVAGTQVFLIGQSSLTVAAVTTPGAHYVVESAMEIDALVTPYQGGLVVMSAEAVLSVVADTVSLPGVLRADSGMNVVATTFTPLVQLRASSGMVITGPPKMSTLVDNFNSGIISSSLWTTTANVGIGNAQLYIGNTASVAGTWGLTSRNYYDLRNSAIHVQFIGIGNSGIVSFEARPINLTDSTGQNGLYWYNSLNQGVIKAFKKVAGTATQVFTATYNSTTHQYLRIQESAGTTYWDYSADGSAWTNAHSEADPFSLDLLQVSVQVDTTNAEVSTTDAYFDNINWP